MHAFCPHVFAMPKQPTVTIHGTRHCAACGVDAIERMLPISTPAAIANALHFDDRASRIGVTGALMLLWSWGKMQDSTEQRRLANRLGRVFEELKKIHGNLFAAPRPREPA